MVESSRDPCGQDNGADSVSMLTVGQAVLDVNWVNVLSVSAVAGVISMLTSVAGLPEVE